MSILKIEELSDGRFTLAWCDGGAFGGELRPAWRRSETEQAELLAKRFLTDTEVYDLECAVIWDAAALVENYCGPGTPVFWTTKTAANEALKLARNALKDLKVRLKTRTLADPPWMIQARAHGWGPLSNSD